MKTQIIEKDGVPEFAVIPYADYQRLIEIAEEKSDAADILAFRESNEETFPGHVVEALLNGTNPIKVYRQCRQMTQADLAQQIGKSLPYVAKLEAGDRKGTIDVMQSIAEALEVDLEQLI